MSTNQATLDEVWQLFREVANQSKETDRKFQESEHRFQETEKIMKERDREFDRRFEETKQLMKERDQELSKKIKQVTESIGKLGNRLGDFIEDAVYPAAVRLFQEQKIQVHEIHRNISVQRGNEGLEIDLLVENDQDVVAIECKSNLTVEYVDAHLQRLNKLKRLMPKYASSKVMGAVAAMAMTNEVVIYAYRHGLYVIGQSGEQLIIRNDNNFVPKVW